MNEGNKSESKPELESLASEHPQSEGGIRTIDMLREYILSTKELNKYIRMVPASPSDLDYDEEARPTLRVADLRDNFPSFKGNLLSGCLVGYEGTFVAYYKGVLCGQSHDRNTLFDMASKLYDETNPFKIRGLAVFKVPTEIPEIGKSCDLTEDAKGAF